MKWDDHKIQEYIDGKLKGDDLEQFELELKKNKELQTRVDVYKFIDLTLTESASEFETAPQFTGQVMENLDKQFEVKSSFWNSQRIFILLLVGICFIAGIFLIQSNLQIQNLIPEINASNPMEQEMNVTLDPKKYIDKDIFFKVMIYFNAILGLLLLDRAILRPLFRSRKQNLSI